MARYLPALRVGVIVVEHPRIAEDAMRFLATGIHSRFCARKVLVEDVLKETMYKHLKNTHTPWDT